jgi:type VI secretion system protein ImpJ
MRNERVMWNEGMVLMPQHFQQQERFLLSQMQDRLSLLSPHGYGFEELEFDTEKLQFGMLILVSAKGLLPDGTAFSCPLQSPLPPVVQINAMHLNTVLYLCTSKKGSKPAHATADEAALSPYAKLDIASDDIRYLTSNAMVENDNLTEVESATLELGVLSFRICTHAQLRPDDVAMPLVSLKELSDKGAVLLNEEFTPPLIDLNASKYLRSELNQLLALIAHRTQWQIKRLNQPQTSSMLETSDFLLLQTLMRYEAIFRFELSLKPVFPLVVLRYLLSFASEMAAVQNPPVRISTPLGWDGENVMPFFSVLLKQLRDMLSSMRERLALELGLHPSSDGLYVSPQTLPLMGVDDRLLIAVQAQVPDDWFWNRFSGQVVICASDLIVDRVRLQMRGVELKHLSTAPAELPLQAGWHYFELIRDSHSWHEIVQSRSLGLHISGHWPGLAMRVWLLQANALKRVGA